MYDMYVMSKAIRHLKGADSVKSEHEAMASGARNAVKKDTAARSLCNLTQYSSHMLGTSVQSERAISIRMHPRPRRGMTNDLMPW